MDLKTDYSRIDLCWFAGWWEGEGSISNTCKTNGKTYLKITGNSTDKDIIEKIQSVFGGRIYGPYYSVTITGKQAKAQYLWSITKTHQALALAQAIRPMVCLRRQAQIDVKIKAVTMAHCQADDES